MRNALLVIVLVTTAACGAYHFPGPGDGTGIVSGQVIAYPCGPVEPANQKCVPGPPAGACMPQDPNTGSCGSYPMPGLGLVFTNGDATRGIKTDTAGHYAIELPSGTWTVSTLNFGRIISGPETLVVTPGANIVADYVVDTGIRAAA
jgi:hypothetical protein